MAKEKIRIQILDIVEDPLNANLIDFHLGTATGTKLYYWVSPLWNTAFYQYTVPFTGPIAAGMTNDDPHYFEDILMTPLVTGVDYVVAFETENMQDGSGTTCTGEMGFDTLGGISGNAKRSTDGYYSETFTATGPEVRLYSNKCTSFSCAAGEVSNAARMTRVSIREKNLDIVNNVVGEVDITDSEDFPLSLSYAVSDGKNLEQRFGDYSKTFDVPATDNNNKLFAHRYDVKMTDKKDMAGMKPCRILVGDTEFFRGMMQLGGVAQTSKPNSYSCTIYGGNFGWISQLKNFNLCDIYDDSYEFDFTYTDIWAARNANQANSEVVFPLISYGDFWPNWGAGLYGAGYVNLRDATDDSQDWRPSFWIYNMIEKIFDNIGYSVESNFINNGHFKSLISHFPPEGNITQTEGSMFATRKEWNQSDPAVSGVGIWDSSIPSGQKDYQIVRPSTWVTGAAGVDTGDSSWQDIILDEVIDDPNGCYNPSTGYWTCSKAGRYNFAAVVHLVVGNFDNSQATTGVVASGNDGATADHVEVGIRVRLSDGSGNTMVSAFDNFGTSQTRIPFKMQWGKSMTQASSPAPYASTAIPVLMGVEKEMQNPYAWWVPTGWQVNVQVQVRFRFTAGGSGSGNVNEGNAKIGYICLSDEGRTSFTGQNGVHFFNGDSYYSNVCQGYIGNTSSNQNVGAVRRLWSQRAKPYFKVEPVDNQGFNHGLTYKINDCLPCSVSQTDFLKGLAQLFNLQFRTDAQERKVYIEPFDDFFREKKYAYDWTNKVDFSMEIKDTFDIGLYEDMSWEYKNDSSDGLMKFVNESFRESDSAYHFFNHREEIGDQFRKGTNRNVNPVFASTWMDWNADASGQGGVHPVLMPVINKTHSIYGYGVAGLPTRPDKIMKYLPRIMKFKGYIQSPNHSNFMTTWVYQDASGGHGTASSPRAVFVDWESTSGNIMNNLSFADEIINPPMTNTQFWIAGLYTLYWRNMIEQYKANPRIRTYYIKLDMSDMINIDLRRLVYIDGSYWRINKIIDYAPAKDELTKVEFVQWTEQVPIEKRRYEGF